MSIRRKQLQTAFNLDGGAILDSDAGLISTLNPTGALVWQHLRSGDSIPEIVARLARETGEDTSMVENDVRDFIEELKRNNLSPS